MKQNGLIASKLCDGSGVDRIINFLLPRKSKDNTYVNIRPVTIKDKELVYSWQILPSTRKYSRNPDIPDYEEHSVWFEKKLKDINNYFYIILHKEIPSGVVRLDLIERAKFSNIDIRNQLYEISVYVSDDQYGKGLASIAVSKIESLIPKSTIMAYVSKQNSSSQKLFEKVGYKKIQESTYIKYTI
nr:GNAT family N-acetyltransferase [Spartinivicinus marinus]